MNIGEQISVWVSSFKFWGYIHLEVKLLDHMVIPFLIFWGTKIFWFSTVTVPLYLPTRTAATAAAAAKSLQSCPTLCDPVDSSPPGSPIPGILQARTLEWVAISFSSACKWKMKVKSLSRADSSQPHGLQPTRLLHPWDFPGKSTGVGCHHLLPPAVHKFPIQFLYIVTIFKN